MSIIWIFFISNMFIGMLNVFLIISKLNISYYSFLINGLIISIFNLIKLSYFSKIGFTEVCLKLNLKNSFIVLA